MSGSISAHLSELFGRGHAGVPVFTCAKQGCTQWAEWEPALVVLKRDEVVRVGVPTPVCTRHRRGLRAILLEHGMPEAEAVLAQRGLDVSVATFRIEFTPLN